MEEVKKQLGFPESMSEADMIANTHLHTKLIQTYNMDPPPGGFMSKCCSFCCRMIGSTKSPTYLVCQLCTVAWCSEECRHQSHSSLHTTENCTFSSELFNKTLSKEDKGTFLKRFQYCLPGSAPASSYHQPHIRIAPIFVPTIGWIHGQDTITVMAVLHE